MKRLIENGQSSYEPVHNCSSYDCYLIYPFHITQEGDNLEEVLVTGSLIKGTATDAETNVSVYDRSALDMQTVRHLSTSLKT